MTQTLKDGMVYKHRVHYCDTDADGLLYHARFLDVCERARFESFTQLGFDFSKRDDLQYYFIVKRVEIEYKSPARLGETIDVITTVESISNTSFVLLQVLKHGDRVVAEVKVVVVMVGLNFKPIRIPDELRKILD